jgi:hypothetical protein
MSDAVVSLLGALVGAFIGASATVWAQKSTANQEQSIMRASAATLAKRVVERIESLKAAAFADNRVPLSYNAQLDLGALKDLLLTFPYYKLDAKSAAHVVALQANTYECLKTFFDQKLSPTEKSARYETARAQSEEARIALAGKQGD